MMLNPDNRHLYLEALRPPVDYELVFGIGTTYSLDLTTLMMVPLAAADFTSGEDDKILKDRIAILESLQKSADKLSVFCQQGQISIPDKVNSLYSFLEEPIVEVMPEKEDRVFHPKIWLLKFINDQDKIKYRLIILSRNITFDKAWDTILVLEGITSEKLINSNKPLADFIKYLPEIAVNKMKDKKQKILNEIAKEIMYVDFIAPDKFNSKINFYPLGIKDYNSRPFPDNYQRTMIISPFISSGLLKSLKGDNNILVSKDDEISQIHDEIKSNFKDIYVVNNMMESLEEEDKDEIESDVNIRSGLHTKLFIFENNNEVEIITGSANATNAAFNGNIEFMAGLKTSTNNLGIDNILSDKLEPSFIGLLNKYYDMDEDDKDENQDLKDKLRNIKKQILNLSLNLIVHEKRGSDNNLFDLEMKANKKSIQIDVEKAKCWPITRDGKVHSLPLSDLFDTGSVTFNSLSLISLARFIAFSIEISSNGRTEKINFVLNLPIEGVPENRNDEILYNIIDDRNKFIRYLIFLLGDSDNDFYLENNIRNILNRSTGKEVHELLNIPLLEEMVKALSEEPKKLDAIDRLVKRLNKDDKAKTILPEGFESCWESIMKVRSENFD